MTEVEQVQKIIANLEDKLKAAVQRYTELVDERGRVSLAAHTGDKKARQRLDAINAEYASHGSELMSVESAITEANARLEKAKAAEALAADREAAKQVSDVWAKVKVEAAVLDDAFADITTSIPKLIDLFHQMHTLGAASRTSEQLRLMASISLKTAIQSLPQSWVRDFEF